MFAPPELYDPQKRKEWRLESERDAARAEMVRYLDALMSGDVPREVEERFGPEAALPNETKDAA